MDSLVLHHPFGALLCGPSGVGKSYFLKLLLSKHTLIIQPAIDKVVWFYSIYQPLYDEIPNVTFVEGFPSDYKSYLGTRTLFIVDDLVEEYGNSKDLLALYTKASHHLNISIFTITQNIFHKGSAYREISLNSHYMFLFKCRRDINQIAHLAKQLYPRKTKFFLEAYEDATKKPYGYLLVDMKPNTEETFRLRTNILPGEFMCIYQPK